MPQTERVKRIERSSTMRGSRSRRPATRCVRPRRRSSSSSLPQRGRTASLSAQVQSYALGLTITFLALVLAAGALAGERDENVLGRLARGLVPPGRLVAAKVALAGIVATVSASALHSHSPP